MRLRAATLLVLTTLACSDVEKPPAVAATWSGGIILASDLKAELDLTRAESGGEARIDPERLPVLRRAVLAALLDRRLLAAEARRLAIPVTPADVDEVLGKRTNPEVAPVEGLRARIGEQLLVERLLVREVAARIAVGPDEAKEWYEAHPADFARGEQVHAFQIVVPTTDASDLVRRELNRGATFAAVARQYSTSPDAASGGDLGWFSKGQLPAEFDAVCFSLRKGQTSDFVQTPWGLHLFKVTDTRPAGKIPFEAAQAGIERTLLRAAVAKAQAAYIEKIRSSAGIVVDEAEVDKIP